MARPGRKPADPATALAWAAQKFGITRGAATITTENRGGVRFWLTANGMASEAARALPVADLARIWNDTTNDALNAALYSAGSPRIGLDFATAQPVRNAPVAIADTVPTHTTTTQDTHHTMTNTPSPDDAAALAAILSRMAKPAMDEEAVRRMIAEALAGMNAPTRTEIVVTAPDGIARNVGKQHALFPRLLKMAAARVNVWMRGPAGSGKTTGARNVADALGLPFYFTGAVDTEYKLLGFTDAAGRIVSRPFRDAWTRGGVFLFDEVDASLPGALLAFNAALANDACDFPDGCIARHQDCIILAAANTWGLGADTEYVGRMKQDAAFLDRFSVIDWSIDEELERAICPNLAWCRHVQAVRANVARQGVRVMVSPRASIMGARLLAAGLTWDEAEAATIRKAMSAEQWAGVCPSVREVA